MSEQRYPAEVVAYVARVADALKGLTSHDPGWGATYISEVRFGFDGEDALIRLSPSDFGGFEVVMGKEPA